MKKLLVKQYVNHIIESLTHQGPDIIHCRSQTMDGVGNMAGEQAGMLLSFLHNHQRQFITTTQAMILRLRYGVCS